MKLSDIRGEAAFDAIAAIVGPIANIMGDKRVVNAIRTNAGKDAALTASALTPLLLRDHRDDVVCILAALNMKTPKEYVDGVSFASLVGDVYEALTDEALLGFLPQGSGEHGSTSGSTEAQQGQTS